VWSIDSNAYPWQGAAVLMAHDALNVATLLYSSNQSLSRDNPGPAVKFVVPTVVNGKVYVAAEYQVSVYGLLNGQPQTAAPVINPESESFSSSVQVTITDSTAGATIYYTTDGSTPTTSSAPYTGPIPVSATTTLNAIASAPNYTQSAVASATYTMQIPQAATPTFNPPGGNYALPQSVTISDSTPNATIYYTTDGSTPTTSSAPYTGPILVIKTTTIQALAAAPGYLGSSVGSATYTYPLGL
jgi:hypothetical protein